MLKVAPNVPMFTPLREMDACPTGVSSHSLGTGLVACHESGFGYMTPPQQAPIVHLP